MGRLFSALPGGRQFRGGLVLVGTLMLLTLAAGVVAPGDPLKQDHRAILSPPNLSHPLGTDSLGRDVAARLLHGGRMSLSVAVGAVFFMILLGVPLGAVAGYYGGLVDSLIMRTADVLLAFPFILGAIALMTVMGPGWQNVFLTLGLLGWPQIARLTRAQVANEASKDYISAVKVVGGSPGYIITRHLLPNAAGPVAVFALMGVGAAIMTEATLSFLGIGVRLPYPAWGSMLAEAVGQLAAAPWLTYGPGAAVVIACLGFNLLSEGLREVLDIG